ncbi:MAG TPA: hypothetical protein VI140_04335 [Oxalicibacterium sp.]
MRFKEVVVERSIKQPGRREFGGASQDAPFLFLRFGNGASSGSFSSAGVLSYPVHSVIHF